MLHSNFRLCPNDLTPEEYRTIKDSAGWGEVPCAELCAKALAGSLYYVAVRDSGRAVAMGRLFGDGVFYWHVQDVIVLPVYQGKGIGTLIMKDLLDYVAASIPGERTTVGLMAAHGKEPFYEKLGFEIRDSNRGLGMQRKVISGNNKT